MRILQMSTSNKYIKKNLPKFLNGLKLKEIQKTWYRFQLCAILEVQGNLDHYHDLSRERVHYSRCVLVTSLSDEE